MKIVRDVLAVIAGLIIGSIVNMSIITISGSVIPPPEGADVTTMEGLKASLPLFEPKHFIMPFLAHFLGTFVGAVIASLIAANKKVVAYIVGAFFLIGGTINVILLPAPLWFNITDLVLAYIPASYIATKIIKNKKTA
jgi:hypothetical protein